MLKKPQIHRRLPKDIKPHNLYCLNRRSESQRGLLMKIDGNSKL